MSETTEKVDGRRARHAARRPELLAAAVDYITENGLAGLSIRPLAAGIGISHRTLLHHFGSKEELLIELFREVRARQRAALAEHAEALEALPASQIPYESWRRLGKKDQEPLFRLFFELWSQALQEPDRYAAFLDEVIGDWLPIFKRALEREGCPDELVIPMSSVMLAVFRGLMLDVLSTRERKRVDAAFRAFGEMAETMRAGWAAP
jgi:AcrR family transcriptional regulator